jgi:uncharacterized protein Yka (UPF0111/DUF47 family)
MGTELLQMAPDIGEGLREIGGWGVSVVFAGLLIWVLLAYFRLQDHVLKLSTTLAATNSKTVSSLDAVTSKISTMESTIIDLRTLNPDVKDMEKKLDVMNERLLKLCVQKGGES